MRSTNPPRVPPSYAPSPALLDVAQAAQFLRLGKRTLENWRYLGGGPPFLRVGRAVRYSPVDLAAWLDERRFRSTSEADHPRAA